MSQEVKRLGPVNVDTAAVMREMPNGAYVMFSAYDDLEKENDRLKKDLETMNQNCISLNLHESRMRNVEEENARLKAHLGKAMDELYTISCATVFNGMIQKENAIAAKKVYNEIGESLVKEALAGGQDGK